MNSRIEEIIRKRVEAKVKQEVHVLIAPVRRALANMRTDDSDRAELDAMMVNLNAIEVSMVKERMPHYMQQAAEAIADHLTKISADQIWGVIK